MEKPVKLIAHPDDREHCDLPDELLRMIMEPQRRSRDTARAAASSCRRLHQAVWQTTRSLSVGWEEDIDAVRDMLTTLARPLPDLQKVTVTHSLADRITHALASMPRLQSLTIYNGSPGRPCSVKYLEPLTSLTALSHLDLSKAYCKEPFPLDTFSSLQFLELGGEIDTSGLAGLTALRSLLLRRNSNVFGTNTDGAQWLACLTALTHLGLPRCGVEAEGARMVGTLTVLQTLNLADNDLGREGMAALPGLTGLQQLDLEDVQLPHDAAVPLSQLAGLTKLNLKRSDLGPTGTRALISLTGLRTLALTCSEAARTTLTALTALTALRDLTLWRIPVRNMDLTALLPGWTTLTRLELNHCELRDWAAHALPALTGLQSLTLTHNPITCSGIRGSGLEPGIARMTTLTSLNLRHTRVGEAGALALTALTSLVDLNLRGARCHKDGNAARALQALPALKTLSV